MIQVGVRESVHNSQKRNWNTILSSCPNSGSAVKRRRIVNAVPKNTDSEHSVIDMATIMSIERSQRISLLKSRFAGIIYKAKHRDESIDSKKLEEVVKAEELQRKHEAATELKRKREAERRAREDMERRVEIEDNYSVLKYMEDLCGPGYLIGYN